MSRIVVDRMVEDENGNEALLKGHPIIFGYKQPNGSWATVHGPIVGIGDGAGSADLYEFDYEATERAVVESLVGRQLEITTELDVPSGIYTIKDWKIK